MFLTTRQDDATVALALVLALVLARQRLLVLALVLARLRLLVLG
jgi:hypothetical protein